MTTLLKKIAALAISLFAIFGVGCADRKPTLIDVLQSPGAAQLLSIEQLALHSDDGLLIKQDLQQARSIRLVDQSEQVQSFYKAIVTSFEGRRWANHPVGCGEVVLRVKARQGEWYIFCQIEENPNRRYCILYVGVLGETNRNHLSRYESEALPVWLFENGMSPIRLEPKMEPSALFETSQ